MFQADGAVFDEENLVSHAGLVPVLQLAEQAGLSQLLDEHVRFVDERVKSRAANATPKLTSIIAGMAAGADSIDDLDVIRAGRMKHLFGGVYTATTQGILLREFTHGHTRQLSAVLRRHLIGLAGRTPILSGIAGQAFVDIDSGLRPVDGHAKQGASFGHTKIAGKTILRRGLSPLSVTISTPSAAPVVAGVRLRAGRAGSSRGAASMLTEAINTATAAGARTETILVRGDSAYGNGITAVVKAGARYSFTMARNPAIDAAIATIPDEQYTPVHYPGAVTDPDSDDCQPRRVVAPGVRAWKLLDPAGAVVTGPDGLLVRCAGIHGDRYDPSDTTTHPSPTRTSSVRSWPSSSSRATRTWTRRPRPRRP